MVSGLKHLAPALAAAVAVITACTPSRTTDSAESPSSVIPSDSRIRGIYVQYDEDAVLTPAKAPSGYSLIYLTHYGRHGARYMEKKGDYERLLLPLEKAAQTGNLTPAGDSLLGEYRPLYAEAAHRVGELTALGQTQHRGIAARMYANHKALFAGGKRIEVRSTNLERTMLSMFAFCNALQSLSPGLEISADASVNDIHTINPHSVDSKFLTEYDANCRHRGFYEDFMNWGPANVPYDKVVGRLFKDVSKTGMSPEERLDFVNTLFTVACATDCMDTPQADFFRYFTYEEAEILARWDNMFYYKAKGPGHTECPRNWAISKYMLDDIISRADEDMENGVSARLRFGHDGCIMALFCLMGIDGWHTVAENLDKVWEVWDISKVPMAANIQISFWKNSAGDVLIQPRYNERPLKLPLEEYAPEFYSWTSFKNHYLSVIERISEIINQ